MGHNMHYKIVNREFFFTYSSKEKHNVMNCFFRSSRKDLWVERDLMIHKHENFKNMKF